MSYFVFKLNIQPDILLNYKENEDKKHLLFKLIPTALEDVMEVKEKNNIFELIAESNNEEDFKNSFLKLENKTLDLLESYNKILLRYKEKQDIYYTQNFLKLNESCMRLRSNLERHYPGIMQAYEIITDEEIDEYSEVEFESKVGTGITHLRKFYKIKLYLEKYKEDNAINPLDLVAYYNPYTEHILVKTILERAARNYIIALTELINKNTFTKIHLGKVNINPIYDLISLEGEYSEISYTIVYPNGNPPLERYNILKDSGAKEQISTLIGTDGKPLINEPIEKMLENEAKKGYLKSLTAKFANTVKKPIQKMKKITLLDKNS